ncbi:MAG: hypothetical protein H7832_12120 [Magnetococcus sp. DMHC-6]
MYPWRSSFGYGFEGFHNLKILHQKAERLLSCLVATMPRCDDLKVD